MQFFQAVKFQIFSCVCILPKGWIYPCHWESLRQGFECYSWLLPMPQWFHCPASVSTFTKKGHSLSSHKYENKQVLVKQCDSDEKKKGENIILNTNPYRLKLKLISINFNEIITFLQSLTTELISHQFKLLWSKIAEIPLLTIMSNISPEFMRIDVFNVQLI